MNPNDILKKAKEALGIAIREKKDTEQLIKSLGPAMVEMLEPIGPAIVETLLPMLEKISENSTLSKEEVLEAIKGITINVPDITVPTPQVNVNVPDIKVPLPNITVSLKDFKLPEFNIPPIKVPEPKVTVNFDTSKIRVPDINMPDEMNVKGWLNLMGFDKGLYTNPLPVQLRDAQGNPIKILEALANIAKMGGGSGGGKMDFFTVKAINDLTGTPYSNANPFPVTITSGGSATSASNIVDSGGVAYSGSNPIPVYITSGGSATSASNIVDSSGVAYSGSNPLPVVITSGAGATSASNIVDSGGVAYSGSNPVPVSLVSGALSSTVVVGDQLHDAVDDGGAPLKIGGIAVITNPAAVADGDRVTARFDDLGRQLVRFQVRDLTQSAYVSIASGTETTLLAGVAGTFLDMMWIVASNNSDAAVSMDIRSGTGGSILYTLRVPANGSVGTVFNPGFLKQEVLAGAWTADMPDITGTTVTLSALFSKEM